MCTFLSDFGHKPFFNDHCGGWGNRPGRSGCGSESGRTAPRLEILGYIGVGAGLNPGARPLVWKLGIGLGAGLNPGAWPLVWKYWVSVWVRV